jgi:hypothetical protein
MSLYRARPPRVQGTLVGTGPGWRRSSAKPAAPAEWSAVRKANSMVLDVQFAGGAPFGQNARQQRV